MPLQSVSFLIILYNTYYVTLFTFMLGTLCYRVILALVFVLHLECIHISFLYLSAPPTSMWDIKLSRIESVGLMEDFMILNCHAFDDPVCLRLFGTIRWIHNDSMYLIGVVERASLRTIYAWCLFHSIHYVKHCCIWCTWVWY